jgi:antitoxin component YwqK of YwqJK toxin-antitoxin module
MPTQMVKALDDWPATKMAKYEAQGDIVKNGKFTTWHENGNIRAKGSYDKNELEGEYQSWHPSGDRESSGHFKLGLMHGPWSWWHPNGMKRATGTYIDGTPQGNWRAWNADGKLVNQEHFDRSELEVPTPDTFAQERTARVQNDMVR